jgi:flagellar biosynthetic protein FliR
VTPFDNNTVMLTFLLFCRIGGCLMFMPGFSSSRIPPQARLFLAVATTLALAPLLLPTLGETMTGFSPLLGFRTLVSESLIGITIGLMGRVFFLALDFMGTAVASFVGFSNVPGIPLESAEPNPTIAALITLTAVTLFFITDLHWEVLRGLVASYRVLPVVEGYSAQFGLVQFTDALSDAFMLAIQISAPFIIYSIAINVLFGIINKLTPQIAVYFVSLPFVVMGGLFVLYFTLGEILTIFTKSFGKWLING